MALWKILVQSRRIGTREWRTILQTVRARDEGEAVTIIKSHGADGIEFGSVVEATELKDDDEGF